MQTIFIHHLNVFIAVRYYPLSVTLFNILSCWRSHVKLASKCKLHE